jgi:outer membrane protein assembly factor BamB
MQPAQRGWIFWTAAALFVGAAAIATFSIKNEYPFFAGYLILQFMVLATAWNILGGYAGYVNFGTPAFFALGAYTAIFLIEAWRAPLPVQILGGGIASAALGLGIGYLTLRLRGVFFSIATFALSIVVQTLIINWDQEAGSFAAALDKRTGNERWRVARDEITSWATPIVVEHAGKAQVVISGTNRVRAYDLATGEVLWQCGGLSANVVASPVAGGGMVFAGSSYDKRALLAIRLDGARGDITGTPQVAWSRSRSTPYVPSPLLYGEALYFIGHYQGILTRVDARTGRDRPGAKRLDAITDVYASPVGAADRVYVTDRDGTTVVLRHADDPEILAVNRLKEGVNASAAVAGGEIFLRGEKHLYSIAEPGAP